MAHTSSRSEPCSSLRLKSHRVDHSWTTANEFGVVLNSFSHWQLELKATTDQKVLRPSPNSISYARPDTAHMLHLACGLVVIDPSRFLPDLAWIYDSTNQCLNLLEPEDDLQPCRQCLNVKQPLAWTPPLHQIWDYADSNSPTVTSKPRPQILRSPTSDMAKPRIIKPMAWHWQIHIDKKPKIHHKTLS